MKHSSINIFIVFLSVLSLSLYIYMSSSISSILTYTLQEILSLPSSLSLVPLKNMFILRSSQLVGCFLLIFLSISALNSELNVEARYLHQVAEKPRAWRESPEGKNDKNFFATINRKVPSSPDPLHNR